MKFGTGPKEDVKGAAKFLKVLAMTMAAIGGISMVSSAVFASVSARAFNTTAQSITSGTFSLTESNQVTVGTTNGFSSTYAISNVAPGDTVNRYFNLTNGGTLPAASMTAQIADTGTISNTVTAASSNGTTVTYTYSPIDSSDYLKVGDIVTITGLSTAAFNLSSVTVATASATQFTVTNPATGTAVTGASATATVPDRLITDATNGLQFTLSNCSTEWSNTGTCPTATVTGASGSGTVVTYTAANTFAAGDLVSVTGLSGLVTITAISGSGTVVTYSTASTTGLSAGQSITITGATTAGYNGAKTILAVNPGVSFTVTNATTGATSVAVGTYTSAFNLNNLTIATASSTQFTVTNATVDRAVTLAAGTATPSINAVAIMAATPGTTFQSTAQTLTAASLNLFAGGINHIKVNMVLPAGSEVVTNGVYPSGTVQGQAAVLTLSFIEQLRTNTTSNG